MRGWNPAETNAATYPAKYPAYGTAQTYEQMKEKRKGKATYRTRRGREHSTQSKRGKRPPSLRIPVCPSSTSIKPMCIQYVHQTQALVRPPRNAHTAMRTRHHAMRTRHALSAHRVLSPYIHLKQTQTLSPSFRSTRSKRPPRTDLTPTHTHTHSLSLSLTHTQRYKDQK